MSVVSFEMKLRPTPSCTVSAFGFWMRFQSYNKYLDWMDETIQVRFKQSGYEL